MEHAATARPGFPGAPTASSFGNEVSAPAISGAGGSAASWPAIFAGAFVATAATLVLGTLGAGLGFAAAGPWPARSISPTSFAVSTAIWLIVTQWVSAALGGYIAGRLRTRWVGTHTHEVFFRDTAHGLITWAVATVLVGVLFAAAAGSGMAATGSGVAAALHGTADAAATDAVAQSARHAAAQTAIYLSLSMLVGAFIACVSAVLGGRLRDEHV
ncbi:MAG TPA: hypothetical protein VHV81_03885 [Steroidobacteraceae bacterium]|nr:hypothetical protein [Steroidobacteraceae bacterium]